MWAAGRWLRLWQTGCRAIALKCASPACERGAAGSVRARCLRWAYRAALGFVAAGTASMNGGDLLQAVARVRVDSMESSHSFRPFIPWFLSARTGGVQNRSCRIRKVIGSIRDRSKKRLTNDLSKCRRHFCNANRRFRHISKEADSYFAERPLAYLILGRNKGCFGTSAMALHLRARRISCPPSMPTQKKE